MNNHQNQTEGMFNIDELMNDLFLYVNQELQKHGKTHIEANISCHSKTETCQIDADEERLWQILVHLLDNAVKYIHRGFILFGYRLSGMDSVDFFVNDTRTENYNINLSVVHTLAEQMGSSLKVIPTEDRISSFSFTVKGLTKVAEPRQS